TLLASASDTFRKRRTAGFADSRLILVSVVTILCFFSASSSKLIPYILPLFPPAAALAFAQRWNGEQHLRWSIGLSIVIATIGLIAGWFVLDSHRSGDSALANDGTLMALRAVAAILIGSAAAFASIRNRDPTTAIVALSLGWIVAATFPLVGSRE